MPEIAPAAGTHIGNYLSREIIGQGAFGQVWKAVHHERPRRVVAVKIAIDPAYRQQLSHEGCLPDLDHPNAWGLHDMHGNVWEWTHDWYGRYPSARPEDPAGLETGQFRVLRGGSWNCSPTGGRSANRCTYTPDYRNREFGLRVVVEAE